MSVFEGVFVAAVTPRRDNSTHIDLGAALDVIDYLCAAGAAGIALFGATGEFIHFDIEERIRVQGHAVRRSRVPVLVNVSHSTLSGAVRLAEEAAAAGAAGLLLMPPCFYRYGRGEIQRFYQEFFEQTGPAPPLLLYNIPAFTSEIDIETAEDLILAGVASGIKDSSGRWDYFQRLGELRRRKPFTLFVGNDALFTRGRGAGADGVVSGVACAVPELMLALDRAIVGGAAEPISRLQARLDEFLAWLDRFPTPVGVRRAVALRGLTTGPLAVALSDAGEKDLGDYDAWFRTWLPEVIAETGQA